MFKKIVFALDYLWPEDCLLCTTCLVRRSHFMGPPLCPGCRRKISNIAKDFLSAKLCTSCGFPIQTGPKLVSPGSHSPSCDLCGDRHLYLDGISVMMPYLDPFRSMITAWKYQNRTSLGRYFVQIMIANRSVMRKISADPCQRLTIVPSGGQGRRRLFYPARLLAKQFNVDFIPYLKKRKGGMQHLLDRATRNLEITGLFKATRQLKKDPPRSVILFDDIITTGASLNEAARILKVYGVQNVFGLCLFQRPLIETIFPN